MTKTTPNISICFIPSDLYKTHKISVRWTLKQFPFQQDERAYAGNLICDVSYRCIWEIDWLKTFF